MPGYYALIGSRTPEAKPIIHATTIHATPAPTPKELVRIYDVVKLNRPEISDAEAWKVSDAILEESAKHNLDPILIAALIEVESGFQSAAISPMGARGIMQIMPEVGKAIAREVGLREDSGYDAFRPEHLDDPVLNIKLGIYYLYGLKKIFRSLNHALVAYSHGCKPVDECEVGTLRSLGEGGCASEGSALRSVWRGATAVRPWGSTLRDSYSMTANPSAPAGGYGWQSVVSLW
ncbi:MAG: lytic transglycosylase domain-containing protein [Deltaproteobacteria bacterium]|nr:lytic transglycosylase domain-containing protein [Deltaproteobacteria bacterium]